MFCGVNNFGFLYFLMNEKNLILDVVYFGFGGLIELVINRDSGIELFVVVDVGNDFVKIFGVEVDFFVV